MRSLPRAQTVVLMMAAWLVFGMAWCQADFVILKDGFTLSGKLEIEGEALRDPNGREFWIKKLGGFYVVNDKVRRMTFAVRQVAEAHPDPAERKPEGDVIEFRPPLHLTEFSRGLRAVKIEDATPWGTEGERDVTLVNDAGNTKTFTQCFLSISPYAAKVGARSVRWTSYYLTSELPPATVLHVIRRQLAKKKPAATPLEEKQTIVRFCMQAGWYAEATRELDALAKDFPSEQEKVERTRKDLNRMLALKRADELEAAGRAGQYGRSQELLRDFPLEEAPERVVSSVRLRELDLRTRDKKLQNAKRLFTLVRQDVNSGSKIAGCEEAIAEIDRELNHDNCERLEPFVALALQEEKLRAAGSSSTLQPEQLVALAVSGWTMGKNGAETDVRNAVRLCQARRFMQAYLRTPDHHNRERMLDDYVRLDPSGVDVIQQLIDLLPPPVPFPEIPKAAVDLTSLPESEMKGVPYRLQLPPEYHNHRAYPVLIVLPNVKEEPKDGMAPWAALAARHGYVLVAPKWADLLQASYQFTSKEHDAVLTVLRDVRRRVNVDSERVFLAGFDQGGTLAYDLGMSHPDLFAGVVTICGRPSKIMNTYKYNAQYLPFYVIDGQYSPDNTGDNRTLFEFWVQRGFPSVYVEYSGRGLEFFSGELPTIFDWMSRKKRASGMLDLGGPASDGGSLGNDFRIARPTDNRFYWITTDDAGNGNQPSLFTAKIGRKNDIVVRTSGFKQVSVWLNPAMVDFGQPVDVRVNQGFNTVRTSNKPVEPSIGVLLEDYYQRGDKVNLFTARVDFKW